MSYIFKGTANLYMDMSFRPSWVQKPKCKSDYAKYEISLKYFIYQLIANLKV